MKMSRTLVTPVTTKPAYRCCTMPISCILYKHFSATFGSLCSNIIYIILAMPNLIINFRQNCSFNYNPVFHNENYLPNYEKSNMQKLNANELKIQFKNLIHLAESFVTGSRQELSKISANTRINIFSNKYLI